jgi:hypothetical protein
MLGSRILARRGKMGKQANIGPGAVVLWIDLICSAANGGFHDDF